MHHVEIISVPPETFVQKVILFNTFTSEFSKEKNKNTNPRVPY